MRIPRSRGAVTGVLLIILGLAGALIALVGPYFDFTTDSGSSWDLTTDTLWLSVVPGVAAAIGGFVLLTSANRATAGLGAWLAIAAGAWFVVGDAVSGLGVSEAGRWEHLIAFEGVGVVIAALAAFALGRLAVRSVRDVELAREAELADHDDDIPRRTRESGRFDRDETVVAAPPATTATTDGSVGRGDTLSAADHVRDAARDDDGETRRI